MSSNNTVNIRILDKDYQVNCPPEEHSALIRTSHVLDARMREIRKSGNVIGLERIAVMAALNLTYDLLQAQGNNATSEALNQQIESMDAKLNKALSTLQAPK